MTKNQGWGIIGALAAIGAFLVWQHVDAQPSQASLAVLESERIVCAFTGHADHCIQYERSRQRLGR